MKGLKILVTGANGDLGRSMIAYLNKFKFNIIACDANNHLLAAAESSRRYLIPKATNKNYLKTINKIIEGNNIDLVIFQSDLEIRAAARHINQIEAKVWLPKYQTIVTMQNKFLCNKLWEKKGISVPKSEIVSRKEGVRGNTWLRPLGLISGGGKFATYAKTKKEVIGWISKHDGWGKFTMSEYLPGRIYGFDSLWRDGKLLNSLLKKRIIYASENEAIGFTSNLVKIIENKSAERTAQEAILAIDKKPDGVFSVDMRENNDGVPCVTEINPGRFMTTSLLIFKETGYNLPLDYIRIILGENPKRRKRPKLNQYLFFVKGLTRLADRKDLRIEKI